jgi:hypothetical protein
VDVRTTERAARIHAGIGSDPALADFQRLLEVIQSFVGSSPV